MNELISKLASPARRYATVELPYCGQEVRLQSLTAAELRAYRTACNSNKWNTIEKRNDHLLVLVLVDAEGKRMLTDADMEAGVLANMDSGDHEILDYAVAEHLGNRRDVSLKAETGAALKN